MERSAYLRQTATDWLHYHPCPGTQDNIHRAFVAGAEWADAHPQSPWISVSDKMPEEFEVVIAYAANGHIENSYWDGHYWTGDFYDTTVIYWMPLPKLFQL